MSKTTENPAILFVGADETARARVSEAARRADVIMRETSEPEHTIEAIREMSATAQPALAVFIGPDLERPLETARQICSVAPQTQTVFLTSPERVEQLRRETSLAPLIGHYWNIADSNTANLDQILGEAVNSTRQRQMFRTTLDRINVQLTSRAPSDSADYRRLVISDRYLASILMHAQDAIISTDNKGMILTWNLAAERLFGYSESAIMGKSLAAIVTGKSNRHEIPAILASLRGGQPELRRELIFFRADGSALEVEATLAPVRDDSGRHIGISIIARDMTERKRSEDALRSSEKLAATGRLAATIAHEINNPLESVTNLLYLLERHPSLDASAREWAALAQRELSRVAHIAKQMLGFYREASRPVPVSIRSLVESVLDLYRHKADQNKVTLVARLDFHGEVEAYPAEMRQVFSNLILNAIEAAGSGRRVVVHVSRSRDWTHPEREGVLVTVADNGSGIAAENVNKIFEPFFTTKGEKGTGLGLWVTRGIVQKHGGRIRVRSSRVPGRTGTAFSVFLPAVFGQTKPADVKASDTDMQPAKSA